MAPQQNAHGKPGKMNVMQRPASQQVEGCTEHPMIEEDKQQQPTEFPAQQDGHTAE